MGVPMSASPDMSACYVCLICLPATCAFQVVNLRRTLADLTDAGFSVVVSEELPIPYGSKNRRKQRCVAHAIHA